MNPQTHWDEVYEKKAPDQVSWFCPHLQSSLALIEKAVGHNHTAAIVDIGAGTSTLVDDLLASGYQNLTILDISQRALETVQRRLGNTAKLVNWMRADVTEAHFPVRAFDVWHDRAVFHFLTRPEQRLAYVRNLARAVKPGGHVIISTFGPEGPLKCSGLDAVRYDVAALCQQLGPLFHLAESLVELHQTPFGTAQQFLVCGFTFAG